ncbi:hypothetical protein AB0A74_02845 [Saccharothrix sp. NPDC042600]|uniref:hypothetical protein n=1 Tax=Saccharothrix TaxID=2071 RepID=UPI0028124749|nr:hypothetical protein [Saccharothrix sp.]BFE53289.1 hypothetical protein GCM10017745_67160 [Saccharothrix mutabilis subsp. capreolus]
MSGQLAFGDPEFFSTSQIRDYCNNGARLLRPLYNELHIAAEELEAVLRFVPSTNPQAGGLDSRVRAKFVAGHLHRSADAVEVAVASLRRTYMSFHKHFVNDQPPKPKRQFTFD